MGKLDQYEYLFNTLMLFLTCTGSQFSAIYVSVAMVASIILFCTSKALQQHVNHSLSSSFM